MTNNLHVILVSSLSHFNVGSRLTMISLYPGRVIFFPTLVPGSGNFQLSRLAALGYGLGLEFWVVITIIVSLTLTLTLITTLTVILP